MGTALPRTPLSREEAELPLIQPSPSTGGSEAAVRDRVYRAIATSVLDIMAENRPRTSAKLGAAILDAVTEVVMRTAVKEGYFRLPNGFGSFRTATLKSTLKRLPTGDMVQLPPSRQRLRYEEGAAIRELLGMPYKTSYRRKFRRTSRLKRRAIQYAELG